MDPITLGTTVGLTVVAQLTKKLMEKAVDPENVAKSLGQEVPSPHDDGAYLIEMNDFAVEQLTKEVESLISQLEVYLGNLRFEEEKAAQFGGLIFAPPIVMNTIRIQQEEVAMRVRD